MQFGSLSQDLEILIKDVIRSIERGQGPAKLKDSFNLRDIIAGIDLTLEGDQFRIHYNMVVLGCFFLRFSGTCWPNMKINRSMACAENFPKGCS